MDEAHLDYEEILNAIREAPVTQLPAILRHTVEMCIEGGVFQPGGLSRFVNKVQGTDSSRVRSEHDDRTVEYDDSTEIQKRVFDRVIKWYFDNNVFAGESVAQMDCAQVSAAPLMEEIADEIIRFKVTYSE